MGVEPVEFTDAEKDIIATLGSVARSDNEALIGAIQMIVRREIASLAGLALRRTQDRDLSRSGERNMMVEIANREAAQFWGEVLAQYGLPEESSEK
jgi:hypothetical protein